jgi:hypothetical protein
MTTNSRGLVGDDADDTVLTMMRWLPGSNARIRTCVIQLRSCWEVYSTTQESAAHVDEKTTVLESSERQVDPRWL